mgnify:CR=1 FL=1
MTRTHQRSSTIALLACTFALFNSAPVLAQGSILGWGWDESGAIADVPDGSDFVTIAGGFTYGLALRSNGSLAVWGNSEYGEDMHGLLANAPTGFGFRQAGLGNAHGLAMRADHSLVSWGSDASGLVSATPGGTAYSQVSVGQGHSVALRLNGQLISWGINTNGVVSGTPAGSDFVQVDSAWSTSVALRSDGSVVAWGDDSYGAVSDAPTGTGFIDIAAGAFQNFALRSDGSILGWGTDFLGGLATMPTGSGFIRIDSGLAGSIALHSDGSIVVWGPDAAGELTNKPPGNEYTEVVATNGGFFYALRRGTPGNSFCFGDGTGTPCPCGMSGDPGTGCATAGVSAELIAFGNPQLSADNFGLYVRGLDGPRQGMLLSGANQLNSGLGIHRGRGLLCVGQSIRSQVQITSSYGGTTFDNFQGMPFGATSAGLAVPTNYQFWYRDTSPQSCTSAKFNFSNAWTVTWTP